MYICMLQTEFLLLKLRIDIIGVVPSAETSILHGGYDKN